MGNYQSMLRKHTIPAGTILFHGTSDEDFFELEDSLNDGSWLSDSEQVAEYFAKRSSGNSPRVIQYELTEDVEVFLIESKQDLGDLSESHGIRFDSAEDMRDSALDAGIPGWIIPKNYPTGADILITNTGCLEFLSVKSL